MPSWLITQRSQVQILPPLPGSAGQRPDRQDGGRAFRLFVGGSLAGWDPGARHVARKTGMDRYRSGLLAGLAVIASCQRQPRRAASSSYAALALPWALNATKCAYRRIGASDKLSLGIADGAQINYSGGLWLREACVQSWSAPEGSGRDGNPVCLAHRTMLQG